MSDELLDLIQGFVEESHESFESIESDLLAIEDNPNDLNIVNGIFRVLHTIKGTAGFMGLDDINRLSHKLETIFDMIRKEELGITPELLDLLLPAIDLLKLMVFELLAEDKSDYRLQATLDLVGSINTDGAAPRVEVGNQPTSQAEETSPVVEQEPEEILEDSSPEDSIPVSEALLQDFVVEAEEHLEHIEEALLRLEKNPKDEESIHEVFRGTHSIKGIAGYVNLTKITRLSHRLETIFDSLRKGSNKYTNEMADVVLKGLDLLRTLIFLIKMDEDVSLIEVDDVIKQLGQFVEVKEAAPLSSASAAKKAAKPDAGKYSAFQNLCNQQVITLQAVGADMILGKADADDLMLFERGLSTLQQAAAKLQLVPVTEQTEKLIGYTRDLIKGSVVLEAVATELQDSLGTLVHIIEIIQSASAKEIDQLVVQAMANAKQAPAKPVEQKKPAPAQETALKVQGDTDIKTMRVDAARLDVFMNLIGELIIARNSLNHALGEMPAAVVPTEVMNSLKFVEGAFNRISEELQTTLMDLRLMPVKTVFQKIPRIVRDISRKTGKQIQLQMVGENTQIDKSIIEVIGDPLIHIIRNSCDHGIETIEQRAKVGKPEQGNIILKATNQGSAITIDIIDDGAGINTAKVLEKAIEKGLVREDQAKLLDEKTINQFIFHPGFSTADQVSDISGRGVGMDVVLTNIAKVHGSVEVESERGHGTQIRLLLPLTLAVIDALLVVVAGQKYAIPLDAVKESIEVKRSELQQLSRRESINLRGDIIGVARLSELLDLTKDEDTDTDKVLSVVFIHSGPRILGIVVDDLSNQQEIVVKPLESYLTQIPGISGSTILGSGEIILILQPAELVDLAAQ